AGNWKMNTTVEEGVKLFTEINKHKQNNDALVIIGAPNTHLSSLLKIENRSIKIAAQNCYFENSGAFTGETSPLVLSQMGVEYVIIGHSERREYFNESNDILAKKTDAVLQNNMEVIFCCGEPLEIRKSDGQNAYVGKQLEEGLFHVNANDMSKITIAYEPIWAIGTGETASAAQAQEMHSYIRSLLKNKYGDAIAHQTSILYGGSVKPANAKEIFGKSDVDGGLVGGASLKPDLFCDIIDSF
ncbi:MAG: triose-phosphate isomerase, partial [Saprospiraceae bacterium]